MYSFVSIRVISWLKNLPAAVGGLAKKSVLIREIRDPKICRRQISCIFRAFSSQFVASKKAAAGCFPKFSVAYSLNLPVFLRYRIST